MDKFYNREQQLQQLRAITAHIERSKGQLSVVVGRRRVGKTRLLKEAFAHTTQPICTCSSAARTKKLWWKSLPTSLASN